MACPNCGCKEHYQYCYSEFGSDDDRLERCAACSHVFDIEDSADEDDDDEPATSGVGGMYSETASHQPPIPLNAEHSTEGKEGHE